MEGQGRRPQRRTKAGRLVSSITYEELSRYFHMPSEKACKELGVGLTILKRVCRKMGIPRWPYNRVPKAHQLQQEMSGPSNPSSSDEDSPSAVADRGRRHGGWGHGRDGGGPRARAYPHPQAGFDPFAAVPRQQQEAYPLIHQPLAQQAQRERAGGYPAGFAGGPHNFLLAPPAGAGAGYPPMLPQQLSSAWDRLGAAGLSPAEPAAQLAAHPANHALLGGQMSAESSHTAWMHGPGDALPLSNGRGPVGSPGGGGGGPPLPPLSQLFGAQKVDPQEALWQRWQQWQQVQQQPHGAAGYPPPLGPPGPLYGGGGGGPLPPLPPRQPLADPVAELLQQLGSRPRGPPSQEQPWQQELQPSAQGLLDKDLKAQVEAALLTVQALLGRQAASAGAGGAAGSGVAEGAPPPPPAGAPVQQEEEQQPALPLPAPQQQQHQQVPPQPPQQQQQQQAPPPQQDPGLASLYARAILQSLAARQGEQQAQQPQQGPAYPQPAQHQEPAYPPPRAAPFPAQGPASEPPPSSGQPPAPRQPQQAELQQPDALALLALAGIAGRAPPSGGGWGPQ